MSQRGRNPKVVISGQSDPPGSKDIAASSGNPSENFSELEATSSNELFCQSNSPQNKHIPHIREEKTTEWFKWLIDCQTASSFVFLSLINHR